MEITKMSAAQLTKAMDKASAESSKITQMMIDAGRGNERPSDMMNKSDPLSLKYQKNSNLLQDLYAERNRRQTYHGNLRPIKYQENPMATKKFSPAQIAAQKLFAERARAGTLKKGKRKAAVKRNPDKAKPRAYVKRVSQATGAPPSKRLMTRRKMALKAPAGYFPNPMMTPTQVQRVKQALRETETALTVATRLSPKNQDKELIQFYQRHIFNLEKAIQTGESPGYDETVATTLGLRRLGARRQSNPSATMMTGYQVICMHPKKHVVGIFKTMGEAKQIATAMANANNVAYAVKTVKVHKAHFAA